MPGLAPARADIIVAGAAILDALMEDLGLETIRAWTSAACARACCWTTSRAPPRPSSAGAAPCASGACCSSRAPARSTRRTRARSPRSRSSSSTRSRAAGLHRLGPEERELLEYAALLHDIGTFLSYTRPPPAHLLPDPARRPGGVRPEEIAIMAATAYFHRKARPGPRYEAFSGLDRPSRSRVRRARARSCAWPSTSTAATPGPWRTRPATRRREPASSRCSRRSDWNLERWRLEKRRETLEKALGRDADA